MKSLDHVMLRPLRHVITIMGKGISIIFIGRQGTPLTSVVYNSGWLKTFILSCRIPTKVRNGVRWSTRFFYFVNHQSWTSFELNTLNCGNFRGCVKMLFQYKLTSTELTIFMPHPVEISHTLFKRRLDEHVCSGDPKPVACFSYLCVDLCFLFNEAFGYQIVNVKLCNEMA